MKFNTDINNNEQEQTKYREYCEKKWAAFDNFY